MSAYIMGEIKTRQDFEDLFYNFHRAVTEYLDDVDEELQDLKDDYADLKREYNEATEVIDN